MAINTDWHITYEIITPESAENGDTAENGFVDCNGTQWELEPGVFGAEAGAIKDSYGMRASDAIRLFQREGGAAEDSGGRWFVGHGSTCFRTGAETRLSLHPPDNITGASYDRVARLVGLTIRH